MQNKFSPTISCKLSEIEFCKWLGDACPDEWLEYHAGFLAVDLSPDARRLPDVERKRLKQLAERAMWSFQAGLVHLIQVRRGPECFSYIAIARPKRQPKPEYSATAARSREAA